MPQTQPAELTGGTPHPHTPESLPLPVRKDREEGTEWGEAEGRGRQRERLKDTPFPTLAPTLPGVFLQGQAAGHRSYRHSQRHFASSVSGDLSVTLVFSCYSREEFPWTPDRGQSQRGTRLGQLTTKQV